MTRKTARLGSVAYRTPSITGRHAAGAAGLPAFDVDRLRHLPVEVWAAGFRYRGTFVGADEEELYLRGDTRWWVIRLDLVSQLKVIGGVLPEERPLARAGPLPGFEEDSTARGAPLESPLPEETEH